MARTKQIQKTRSAGTAVTTEITQKQSLDTVQTLIHAGLSCLMYARCLFDSKAFDKRFYKTGSITPYKDYANGKLPVDSSRLVKGSYTHLQILRRQRSKRVDLFLDWLENGAFPLLATGQLRAIQINVHQDQLHRDRIIESYTFTIKYHTDASGIRSPIGLEVGDSGLWPGTTGQANGDLQKVLKEMTRLCERLPELPDDRFVSTNLFYFSDDDVTPKGFDQSSSDRVRFAHADGWRKQTETATLSSRFHSTDVKISHLTLQDSHPSTSNPSSLPTQLEYSDIVSRVEELGLDEPVQLTGEEATTVIEDSPTQATSPPKGTSSITFGREIPRKYNKISSKRPGQTATPETSQVPPERPAQHRKSDIVMEDSEMTFGSEQVFYDSLDTQSSHVPRMKKALQGMMDSEPLTQGDTQTQAVIASPSQTGGDGTPTTASGLDLSASAARYRTPVHPGLNRVKRGRDDDDVFNSPAHGAASTTSIFKRLKCVQSQVAFNANGLPSSPAPWVNP